MTIKQKERLRKQRNQSIRWFVQDTVGLLLVAATVYTVVMILWGMKGVLL